jgi:hypothetical protein
MDDLVAKLDDLATQNFYITRTAHSKLETHRRTLKMQAVKAAKGKRPVPDRSHWRNTGRRYNH